VFVLVGVEVVVVLFFVGGELLHLLWQKLKKGDKISTISSFLILFLFYVDDKYIKNIFI